MIWLDIVYSKKENPNENFAREIMELFTLGEGHYTESDVKEAARAFTGYRINGRDQSFRFAQQQFDSGLKNFMGKIGPWNGDQIIDIIISQPQCARLIGAKIWKFFAYDDPEPNLVDAIASELRNSHYELRPFMKHLFSSEEFYSSQIRDSQIKSPVLLLVQALRTLPIPLPDSSVFEFALRQMGQIPFFPPNVKGWDGGKSWINTATLTFRYKLAHQLVEGIDPQEIGMPKPPAMEMTAPRPIMTPPLLVDQIVSAEDRRQPDKLLEKLLVRTFQPVFLERTFLTLNAQAADSSIQTITGKDHPILVVLQLAGGNDGLNTIIPFEDDLYFVARPTLGIPKGQVVAVDHLVGLNPSLAPLKALYDNGNLAIIQGVGYPNPNRSHFRSTEIWQTASDAQQTLTKGWIGRYFDNCCSGADPTVGVVLGEQLPEAFSAANPTGVAIGRPGNLGFDRENDPNEARLFADFNGLEPASMSGDSIGTLSGPNKSGMSALEYLQRTAVTT